MYESLVADMETFVNRVDKLGTLIFNRMMKIFPNFRGVCLIKLHIEVFEGLIII